MAELKVYLSDGLNEKFRKIAMSIYGYGRGSISRAAEAAFTRWCAEHEQSSVSAVTEDSGESRAASNESTGSRIDPDEREVAPGSKRVGDGNSLGPTESS